jgi:hypothetical protein
MDTLALKRNLEVPDARQKSGDEANLPLLSRCYGHSWLLKKVMEPKAILALVAAVWLRSEAGL